MFGLISKKKVCQVAAEIIAEYETSKVNYTGDNYATRCYKDGHENALNGLVCRLKLMGENDFARLVFDTKRKYKDGEKE